MISPPLHERACMGLEAMWMYGAWVTMHLVSRRARPVSAADSCDAMAAWPSQVGPSAFAGIGVVILLIPLQGFFSKAFGRLRSGMSKISDERIRLISQVSWAGSLSSTCQTLPPWLLQHTAHT